MRRFHLWTVALVLLACFSLLSANLVLGTGEMLPRYLVASGGGQISSPGLHLHSAIGQPVLGTPDNGLTLCSGFLCNPVAAGSSKENTIYLPAVSK